MRCVCFSCTLYAMNKKRCLHGQLMASCVLAAISRHPLRIGGMHAQRHGGDFSQTLSKRVAGIID